MIHLPTLFPSTPGLVARFPLETNGNNAGRSDFDLANNGTIPHNWYPNNPGGYYSSGAFNDTNYYLAPAALNTAISSTTSFFIEGYIYWATSSDWLFDIQAANGLLAIEARSNGVHRLYFPAGTMDIGGLDAGVGWYYWGVSISSAGVKFYWTKANVMSLTPVGTNASTTTPSTVSSFNVGRYSGGGRTCSPMKNIIISKNTLKAKFI